MTYVNVIFFVSYERLRTCDMNDFERVTNDFKGVTNDSNDLIVRPAALSHRCYQQLLKFEKKYAFLKIPVCAYSFQWPHSTILLGAGIPNYAPSTRVDAP